MATANPVGATDPPAAAVSNENFKGEVLDPSVFNKNWVRLGAVAAVVGLAAWGTGYLPLHVAACVHLLSFSINLGMIFWVSCSSSFASASGEVLIEEGVMWALCDTWGSHFANLPSKVEHEKLALASLGCLWPLPVLAAFRVVVAGERGGGAVHLEHQSLYLMQS